MVSYRCLVFFQDGSFQTVFITRTTVNGNYKSDLKETKKDHIDRYSENQVFVGHSILCIVYALTIYGLNYKYQVLPRHTMIWLVFLTFPFILKLIELTNKKNYS